jgi:hypothetical protein
MSEGQPAIEQVQRRYEGEWMGIEGVVGVGSGIDDKTGRPVLKVYVDQKTKALQQQIPAQVAGYPVQIEETGEFHTLPA